MSDGRRFFSGVTLERAVLEAAGHFGVEPRVLSYELVDKQHGFTKRRRVVIKVDPEAPAKVGPPERLPAVPLSPAAVPEDVPAPALKEKEALDFAPAVDHVDQPAPTFASGAAAPASDRGLEQPVRLSADTAEAREAKRSGRVLPSTTRARFDALPRAEAEVERAAGRWLVHLLDLAALDLEVAVRQGAEEIEIELSGADAEAVTEDEGEALAALQHLLPRLMASELEEVLPLRVDCQGFQEYRLEELRRRGQAAAKEARTTRETVSLEPLSPADRRVVHLSVADDATVETESIGRGFFKRVTVRPA
jgi:spoIIIJ-associated protein